MCGQLRDINLTARRVDTYKLSVLGLTSHSTHNRSFQSFQAVYCTGTEKQKEGYAKQYMHQRHKKLTPTKENIKLQNPGSVGSQDIRQETKQAYSHNPEAQTGESTRMVAVCTIACSDNPTPTVQEISSRCHCGMLGSHNLTNKTVIHRRTDMTE